MNTKHLDKQQREKLANKKSRKITGKSKRPFHAGKSKAIKNLRQGQTLYHVHAFVEPDGSCSSFWVDKIRVESRVYNSHDIGCFIKYSKHGYANRELFITSTSLRDGNFSTEQNGYNNHRMFTSRRKMERYIKELEMGIHKDNSVILNNDFPDFNWWPEYDDVDFDCRDCCS